MGTSGAFPNPPWPDVQGVVYGHDLSCFVRAVSLPMPDGSTYTATTFDLDPAMGEVDGRYGLAEALSRRLVTYATTLIDDADYGRDLRQYLNDDVDANSRTLALIASGAEQEVQKDERVIHASATATFLSGILTVSISVYDSSGPFRLTLTVDQVSVSVLLSGVT